MIVVIYKNSTKPGRILPRCEPLRKPRSKMRHSRQMLHSPISKPVRPTSEQDNNNIIWNYEDMKCWKNQRHARKIWMRHKCRIKKSVSHRIPIERCIFPDTHSF